MMGPSSVIAFSAIFLLCMYSIILGIEQALIDTVIELESHNLWDPRDEFETARRLAAIREELMPLTANEKLVENEFRIEIFDAKQLIPRETQNNLEILPILNVATKSVRTKIETDFYDGVKYKVQKKKKYVSTLIPLFKRLGFQSTYNKKQILAPGSAGEATLLFGVHWENVFSGSNGSLPSELGRYLHKHKFQNQLVSTSAEAFASTEQDTYINMFPGMVKYLASPRGLSMASKSNSDLILSFTFPDEFDLWSAYCEKNPSAMWVLKRTSTWGGMQVTDCDANKLDSLTKKSNFVLQHYVSSPVLTHSKKKFDLRAWVLVTSIDPLEVYILDDALQRIARKPYDSNSLSDRCIHSTNYRGKCGEKRKQNDEPKSFFSKGELMEPLLNVTGNNSTSMFWKKHAIPTVAGLISHVIPSIRDYSSKVGFRAKAFQLLSFDLMLSFDQPNSPVLVLDVNADPYLTPPLSKCLSPIFNLPAAEGNVWSHDAVELCSSLEPIGSSEFDQCSTSVSQHIRESQLLKGTCWDSITSAAYSSSDESGRISSSDSYIQAYDFKMGTAFSQRIKSDRDEQEQK